MYCTLFVLLFLLFMLECNQVRGVRDRSTQQNRPTSACITAYESGSGGVGRGCGRFNEKKKKQTKERNKITKEDMYNHLCGQETERRPSDGL